LCVLGENSRAAMPEAAAEVGLICGHFRLDTLARPLL
jgi:hypothetical protein